MATTERPERTAQGYRRFRCRECGRQFNERTGTVLNRAQYPSDVIALVVLWRLRYKLALRDLPEMFAQRGMMFSYEAVRDWEAKLTPTLAEDLRRRRRGKAGCSWYVDETYLKVEGCWCYLYRAIDSSGALVDVMFSERRNMAAARSFFRSARTVTGVTPDRVTTDGHDSYPRAIRTDLGKRVRHRDPRLDSAEDTMSCATSSAPGPATTNMFPPITAECTFSVGPLRCWLSWKRPDRTTLGWRPTKAYWHET